MGTIICQTCEKTLGFFEDEKVTVLYSSNCNCCKKDEHQKEN